LEQAAQRPRLLFYQASQVMPYNNKAKFVPPHIWRKMTKEERLAWLEANPRQPPPSGLPDEEYRETVVRPAREARAAELGGQTASDETNLRKGRRPRATIAPDMVEAAASKIAWDSQTFITQVARSVPYSAFIGREPPLAIETHRRLIGLAMADLFTEGDDAAKARSLSSKFRNQVVAPADLAALRAHPLWDEIRERVSAVAADLAGCKTMADFAEKLEPVMAQEHLRVATFASGNRDRTKAADEITGRRSAKIGRQAPEHRGLFIEENSLARLGDILSRLGHLASGTVTASRRALSPPREEPE
jgi:hypothetical protein